MWRAELGRVEPHVGDLLCLDERERAERFSSEPERVLWGRSRGLLRALLGGYLRADPRVLRFTAGPHGKPRLVGEPAEEITFNLSHSGGLALYAFAAREEVGVDVQIERERRSGSRLDPAALAERVFGQAQARRLRALQPAAREREFLRLWTRHEAEVKCRGGSLVGATTGAGVAAGPHAAEGAGAAHAAERLWVLDLAPFARAAGAVASAHAPHELCRWDWG